MYFTFTFYRPAVHSCITHEVAHLVLLSVRVWWWVGEVRVRVGVGQHKEWKLHFLKCIHKSSYTLVVVSSYQIPGAASFPPDDVFPPFLIPQFLFLPYLHVSILVRFSSLFIFLIPVFSFTPPSSASQFPVFIILMFAFFFPLPTSVLPVLFARPGIVLDVLE